MPQDPGLSKAGLTGSLLSKKRACYDGFSTDKIITHQIFYFLLPLRFQYKLYLYSL